MDTTTHTLSKEIEYSSKGEFKKTKVITLKTPLADVHDDAILELRALVKSSEVNMMTHFSKMMAGLGGDISKIIEAGKESKKGAPEKELVSFKDSVQIDPEDSKKLLKSFVKLLGDSGVVFYAEGCPMQEESFKKLSVDDKLGLAARYVSFFIEDSAQLSG